MIKVSAGLVYPHASVLCGDGGWPLHGSQVAFPLCTHIPGVFVFPHVLFLETPLIRLDTRAHPNCVLGLVTNYLFEGPLTQYSHALEILGVGNFRIHGVGQVLQSITRPLSPLLD